MALQGGSLRLMERGGGGTAAEITLPCGLDNRQLTTLTRPPRLES